MKKINTLSLIIFLTLIAIFIGAGFSGITIGYTLANTISPAPLNSPSWHRGQGTQSNPYEISSAVELRDFANLVNSGTDFEGNYILLTDNINLGGIIQHIPIGIGAYPFSGNFDGGNHMISGLFFSQPDQNGVGLFGVMGANSSIRNIAVEGIITAGNNVGGIVGSMLVGQIENSFFNGTINGGTNVGGIAGNISQTTIINTYTKGQITAQNAVGGIVGTTDTLSNIRNNFSTMRVQGTNFVGGIAGDLNGHARGNAALNSHIIPGDASYRVANGSPATLTNNFAFDNILNFNISGVWNSNWPNVAANGTTVSNEVILSTNFWQNNHLGFAWGNYVFNDGVWYFYNNRLPRLASFMTNAQINQSGQVDHIKPSISSANIAKIINPNCEYESNEFEFNRNGHIISADHILIKITADDYPLVLGIDFYICNEFDNGVNRLNVTNQYIYIRIRGMGEFGGYVDLPYIIIPRLLNDDNLVLDQNQFTFRETPHTPEFSIKYDNFIGLAAGGNMDIIHSSGTSVGHHYVEVVFSGNYEGTARQRFYINRIVGGGGSLAITDWEFGQFDAYINRPRLVGFSGINLESLNYGNPIFFANNAPWTDNIPINAGRHILRADFEQTTNFEAFSLSIYFYITPAQRGIAAAPIVAERTARTILLEEQGQVGAVEFAIREAGSDNELVWQTARMFYDLEPNTEYEIFARYAAQDTNHIAGEKSESLLASTSHIQLSPIAVAGIIGGSAAAVGACVFAGFYFVAKKKKK
ncbi:MAG: hypothetical protein FWE03_07170 [Firmicutes bacterium]|nr:hypothetical protein [Bacillota bacterium]